MGLIHNPRSSRNRKRAIGALPADLLNGEPQTLDELQSTLADFARREVRTLIVSGGDGTVRDVLSALPAAYGSDLPAISILASGNANVIAADVGTAGDGAAGLAVLLDHARRGTLTQQRERPLLRLQWPDLDRAPVLGFFMGAAALSRATRYAHERVLAKGVAYRASVIMTIAGAFRKTLQRGEGWFDGDAMSVAIDGEAPREGARFLFLATSLHKLMLGLWPFWGSAGPLRYLDIDAPPVRLGPAVLPLLRGKPTARMLANGYRSGGASAIRLRLGEPVIIDGESFVPGPAGVVELGVGPTVRFLSP